ncbi:MAG: hypothetical protein WBX78_13315, partial [Pseudolabrys sp.]
RTPWRDEQRRTGRNDFSPLHSILSQLENDGTQSITSRCSRTHCGGKCCVANAALAQDRYGSWLRDNALPQPATVNDPVNVVRQGQSEQFFPVGRSGTVSELSWAMLGKGWPEIGSQWGSTLTL